MSINETNANITGNEYNYGLQSQVIPIEENGDVSSIHNIGANDFKRLVGVENFSTVIAGGIVRNLHTLYEIQYPIQKNNIFKPRHLNQEVYKEKFSSFDIQNLCNFINSRLTNNEIAKIEFARPELNKEFYFSIPIHTRDEAYEYALNRAGLVYDRNFNWSTKYLKVTLINNAFHFSTNYIEYFYQYLNQIGMSLARVPNDDTPMYLLFLEEETLDGFIDWIWGELGGQ